MHRLPRTLPLLLALALPAGCPVDPPGEAPPAPRLQVFQSLHQKLPIAVEAANPFDPNEVRVDVELEDPGGAVVRIAAFAYQPYTRSQRSNGGESLVADGPLQWQFRFTPTVPGHWRWRWERTTAAGVEQGAWQGFDVEPSTDPTSHGFVRKSPDDPRYLEFDDRTAFFPIGENLAWYDHRGTFAYEDWMAKLAASGANYVRLWMPSWAMGLLYAPASLEDWSARMDRAFQLDHVIDLARQHDLYVMLSLQNHGPFDLDGFFGTGWPSSLFNAANGGPLAAPEDLYADPYAREIFRRYLRYVVARWGYSPNVFCWELWNEVDLAEQPDPIDPTVDWHREMAQLLRAEDPNDHLISTSTSDEMMTFVEIYLGNVPIPEFPLVFEPVWQLPEIDFVQLHSYQIFGWGAFGPVARTLTRLHDRMAQYGKPVLIAEAGVDFQGIAETLAADPGGDGFHDLVWAGLFTGSLGSGMSWWWDFVVDTEDWYFHFEHLADFVRGVDFPRAGFVRSREAVTVPATGRRAVSWVLTGPRTLLAWVKNRNHEYYSPDLAPVEDASIPLPLPGEGRWLGKWIDPWTGEILAFVDVDRTGATEPHTLAIPSFSRDVALRLERAGGPEAPSP